MANQGRIEEAITEVRIALETDPLSVRANGTLVKLLHGARRYEEAFEKVQHALELDPNRELLHQYKGRILAAQGRHDEALVELERGRLDEQNRLRFLGWAYAVAGRVEEARAVLEELDELSREVYVSPALFAFIHAGLGENDRAFE